MRFEVPVSVRKDVVLTRPPYDDEHCVLEPVDEDDPDYEPCWSWQGSTNNAGYGQKKRNGRTWNVHVLVYHILVSRRPLPGNVRKASKVLANSGDGMVVDHLCHNRLCCNPAHLELISQSENTKRGARHA